MNLIKTSFLNGIAVFIRMLSLLGINKLLAVYVGPSGYAVIGQLQNLIQLVTNIAGGAFNNSVVRFTSEFEEEESKQHNFWKNAGTLGIIISIPLMLISVFFSEKISKLLFSTNDYSYVISLMGISIPLYVFNIILLSILNGKRELKSFVSSNITGSLFSVFFIGILIYFYSLQGALVALVFYQAINFFITLGFISRKKWFHIKGLIGQLDREICREFFSYFFMSVSSAFFAPFGQMVVRDFIINAQGQASAGNWEALFRLSSAYLLFITSTLSVYYLPKLSILKTKEEIRSELYTCLKIVIPIVFVVSIILYLCKGMIISLLFSKEFVISDKSFAFQIVLGDLLKATSWLFSFILVAKGKVKLYFFSELLFFIVFTSFTYFFLSITADAAAIGYSLAYLIYFFFLIWGVKKTELI